MTLTNGYFLDVHFVTQAAWRVVMGSNPSCNQGDALPVEQVSWDDCQEFLGKLSKRDGHSYRLPTEAEWEFACRAGTTLPFSSGATISTDQANFNGNYPYGKAEKGQFRGKTTPVGGFPANAYGLFDMHGNLWQWCQDWYAEYAPGEAVDPQGPPRGGRRVFRGGSLLNHAMLLRSAFRNRYGATYQSNHVGFRAARTFTP